jgi:hypothetical protein
MCGLSFAGDRRHEVGCNVRHTGRLCASGEPLDEMRFVAATGALGAGVDRDALDQATACAPHFIAADAGTTDAGPFSLGGGQPAFAREAVKHDLALILGASRRAGIPALIGSAGTAGGDVHVDWTLDIAREIAAERGLKFRTAVIYAEQDKGYLKELLHQGRIVPLDPAPDLDAAVIDRSSRIVGMMGVEPLQEALDHGADFVLAGRCSDAALYAALPIANGFPPGLAWHAGKVLECGTVVCETLGRGTILGTIRNDHVIVRPFGRDLRCTPQSVAAHSLYENADPHLHKECSGTLDLTRSSFVAEDDISVRISGSEFIPANVYTVKLEGAELAGYQSIIVGGVRDPLIIRQLDSWLAGVRAYIDRAAARLLGLSLDDYRLNFHVYGRDAVMGSLEPERDSPSHEVGIVLEATAATQELATKLAEMSRQPLLHYPIPEWKGGITGFACLHNPAHIERGAVYRFNLNHVAMPDTPTEMFRTEYVDIG